MATLPTDLLEIILRECASTRPAPWYPSDYARATGVVRDSLDPPLDQLRLGGLIRLTDWEQGKGQGYTLTPAGETVLERPRLVDRLRAGVVPRAEAPRPRELEERPPGWERARAVREALIAPTRPRVTLGLIAVNLLVFAAGMVLAQQRGVLGEYLASPLSGDGNGGPAALQAQEIRLHLGALTLAHVQAGDQWWRLLTTCFIHVGFIHLLMNMYALWVLGPLLERMWGGWRFLLLYASAGVVGSCAALLFPPRIGAAGASGAICGMMGAMAAWVYLNRPYLPRDLSASWMRGIITNVILVVFISMIPGVSAAAHFGGGAAGLMAAVPLSFNRYSPGLTQRALGLLGALLVPAAALGWLGYTFAPKTEADWVQRRYGPTIAAARETALAAYNNHVVEVFNKGMAKEPIPIEPAEAREALAGVTRAHEEIKKAVAVLETAPHYEDAQINQALTFAKDYLIDWQSFFEGFRRALDDRGNWNRADGRPLHRIYEKMQQDYQRFRESVLGAGA